jgi:hypothetical protein
MTKMVQIEADKLQQFLKLLERAVSFDDNYESTVTEIRVMLEDASMEEAADTEQTGDSLHEKYTRLEDNHMRLRRTVRYAVAVDGPRLKHSLVNLTAAMVSTSEFELPTRTSPPSYGMLT